MALPQKFLGVASKEQSVSRSINTVLEIISSLTHCRNGDGYEDGESKGGIKDGGAKCALDTTIIQACNRLDTMLGESSNWDNKVQEDMMRAVTKTHELQHAFIAAQADAARSIQKPSFQLKPTLVSTGAEFLAIYGDPGVKGGAIIGSGATPESALADFDAAFGRDAGQQKVLQPVNPPGKKKPKHEKQ
jgi:hypothetical protein